MYIKLLEFEILQLFKYLYLLFCLIYELPN